MHVGRFALAIERLPTDPEKSMRRAADVL